MSGIRHHLDPATILSLGAGTLDESLALVAASHIAWCPQCAEALAHAEALGGAVLDGVEPTSLDADATARLLARLAEVEPVGAPQRHAAHAPHKAGDVPLPIARALSVPLNRLHWRTLARGIEMHEMTLSPEAEGRVRLWRLAPGRTTPEHGHGGSEITLVLAGSLDDTMGRLGRGDVADLGDDVDHQPVAGTDAACICIIASERPTRFKSLIARLLQPILGT